MRLLAGILTATEGIIRSDAIRLAYVGHSLAIKDDLTVTENVRFARNFLGAETRSTEEAIGLAGLNHVADQARILSDIAETLKVAPADIPGRISALTDDRRRLKHALLVL